MRRIVFASFRFQSVLHGPTIWPWWKPVAFKLYKLGSFDPPLPGNKPTVGYRLWIYVRGNRGAGLDVYLATPRGEDTVGWQSQQSKQGDQMTKPTKAKKLMRQYAMARLVSARLSAISSEIGVLRWAMSAHLNNSAQAWLADREAAFRQMAIDYETEALRLDNLSGGGK